MFGVFFAFARFMVLGSLCDVLRALVVFILWGWFITPWTATAPPAITLIWGMFVIKAALFGVGDIEKMSEGEILTSSLASSISCLLLGAAIHFLFA